MHGVHPHNYAPLESFLKFRVQYREGARTLTMDVHAALMDHLAEHFPERMSWFPQTVSGTVNLFQWLGYQHVKNSRQFFLDLELLPAPEPPGPSAVDPWPWKKA
jgi:hypothetical protein